METVSRIGLVICGLLLTAGPVSPAEDGGGTAERLLAAERAAIDLSPALAAVRAGVAARSSESRATAAAGSPYVEL